MVGYLLSNTIHEGTSKRINSMRENVDEKNQNFNDI